MTAFCTTSRNVRKVRIRENQTAVFINIYSHRKVVKVFFFKTQCNLKRQLRFPHTSLFFTQNPKCEADKLSEGQTVSSQNILSQQS